MKYFPLILFYFCFVLSSNELLAQEKFVSEKHTIYTNSKKDIVYENISFEINGETLSSWTIEGISKTQKHLLGTVDEGEYSITWKFITGISLDGKKGTFVLIRTTKSNNSGFRESTIYDLKIDTSI